MSRAFVKEDAPGGRPSLPDLPVSTNPNWVRPVFLAAARARREALAAELSRLKSLPDGDGTAIAVADRDLRWLDARLATALPVPPAGGAEAGLGARVTVRDEAGATATYLLVGEDESDPRAGMISPFSPLGRALAGARAGDLVRWPKAGETVELEVIDVAWDS